MNLDHYLTALCAECQRMNRTENKPFCTECRKYLQGEPWTHWKPAVSTNKCHLHECQAKVGMFSRHSCRVCGEMFCDHHARKRDEFRLYQPSSPLVRVCDVCSIQYDRILRSHFFASQGDVEALRTLLLGNPELISTLHPRHRTSLLYIGARFGRVEVCQLLVEGYGVVICCGEGIFDSTALHAACYYKQNNTFRYLTSQPIVHNYKNKRNETVLDNANDGKEAGNLDQSLLATFSKRCSEEKVTCEAICSHIRDILANLRKALQTGVYCRVDSTIHPSALSRALHPDARPFWDEATFPIPATRDDIRVLPWLFSLPTTLPHAYDIGCIKATLLDNESGPGLLSILTKVKDCVEEDRFTSPWKATLLSIPSTEDAIDCVIAMFLYTCEMSHSVTNKGCSIYELMNRAMRQRDSCKLELDVFRPFMWRLDWALQRFPKTRLTSYRGMKDFTADSYLDSRDVIWCGFSSTSKKSSVAKSFAGTTTCQSGSYHVTAIRSGVDVAWASRYGDSEGEVLLTCNTAFRIRMCMTDEEMQILNSSTRFTLLQEVSSEWDDETQVRIAYEGLREMYNQCESLFVDPKIESVGENASLPIDQKSTLDSYVQAAMFGDGRHGIILLGEAGSGKSTTLSAIARRMMFRTHEKPVFPIQIQLQMITKNFNLESVVLNRLGLTNRNQLRRLCSAFTVVLLLDGVDESPIGVEAVEWDCSSYPISCVIISVRVEWMEDRKVTNHKLVSTFGTSLPHLSFCCVRTRPFSNDQIDQYLLGVAQVEVDRMRHDPHGEYWKIPCLAPVDKTFFCTKPLPYDRIKEAKFQYLQTALQHNRHHLSLPVVLWLSVYGCHDNQLRQPCNLKTLLACGVRGYVKHGIDATGANSLPCLIKKISTAADSIACVFLRTGNTVVPNALLPPDQDKYLKHLPIRRILTDGGRKKCVMFRHRVLAEYFGSLCVDRGLIEIKNICRNVNTHGVFPLVECLHGLQVANTKVLHAALSVCNNVRHLDFSSTPNKIGDAGLQTLATNCHGLEHLDISGSRDITDVGMKEIATNCLKLTTLNLSNTWNVTDVALKSIATRCTQLSYVNISNTGPKITIAAVQVIGANCSGLKHLDVSSKSWREGMDATLVDLAKHCSGLVHLDVSETFGSVTDASLIVIARCCTKLQYVDVSRTHGKVTDVSIKAIAANCPDLEHLAVVDSSAEFNNKFGRERAWGITDASIKEVAARCPKLQYLNVSKSGGEIKDVSIRAIASRCTKMRHLDLSFTCGYITDESILVIASSCPMLEHLNLCTSEGWLRVFSDLSLVEVAKNCPELKHLDVSLVSSRATYHAITDTSIYAVAQHCSALEHLNVSNRQGVTDFSIQEIAKRCSQLRHINVSHTDSITDTSIVDIAKNCSELQVLDMSHCAGLLTDSGINAVAKHSKNLQRLNVTSQQHISHASLDAIKRSCMHLRELQHSLPPKARERILHRLKLEIRQACDKITFELQQVGWRQIVKIMYVWGLYVLKIYACIVVVAILANFIEGASKRTK